MRSIHAFILGVLFAFHAPAMSMAGPFASANAAYESGDYSQAEKLLASVSYRKIPYAAFLMGMINEHTGRYATATYWFDTYASQAAHSEGLLMSARAHAAFCLVAVNEFQRAQIRLTNAPAEGNDVNASLVFALAQLNIGLKDTDKNRRLSAATGAAKRYKYIIDRLDPQNADALNGYGRAKLLLAELIGGSRAVTSERTEAKNYFKRAIEQRRSPVYFNNLGVALYWLGDYAEAEKNFHLALTEPGGNDVVHANAKRNLLLLEKTWKK